MRRTSALNFKLKKKIGAFKLNCDKLHQTMSENLHKNNAVSFGAKTVARIVTIDRHGLD